MWNAGRYMEQQSRYDDWLETCDSNKIVAIECGAGTAIPTVRYECENISNTLIRINPRESQSSIKCISIARGALDALEAIDQLIK